ncbi:MAG TPA: PDZ domain-containing protein [Gammaproteobacteria bacterium]
MVTSRRGIARGAIAVASLAVAALASAQPSDELPRRAALGVALALNDAGAVIVSRVSDGSAAAEAGIRVGDVIAALDGTSIATTAQVQSLIGAHRGGDVLAIDVERDGARSRLRATLQPFPSEHLPDTTFTYGHVTLDDGVRLRTIVSTPTNVHARAPAVLYLQGGGCRSIDVPQAGSTGQNALIHAIAAQGFVTMRVDKPGAGDSEGPPCAEIGYREELAGYRASLRALLANPAADPDKIFLFGASLGGFFAPILAQDTKIAGISVYGTIAFTPTPYPGRSERFFREIAEVDDILALWALVDARVQVLHGTYDATATASDHAKIAAAVNAAHPGRAEHRELGGLDHGATRQPSLEAGARNPGGGEQVTDLQDAVLEFLRAG